MKDLEKKDGTTDHEQGYFALHCVSVNYKNLMFAVRRASLRTGHQSARNNKVKNTYFSRFFAVAQKDSELTLRRTGTDTRKDRV